MKKSHIIFLICFVASFFVNGQTFEWAQQKSSNFFSGKNKTTVDADGNIYIGGYRNGADQFLYLRKLNPEGEELWDLTIGAPSSGGISAICLDDDNNILLTGSFSDTMDFDPGPGVFTLYTNGVSSGFLLKLDNDGNFIWANEMKATLGIAGAYFSPKTIDTDELGNVVIAGNYEGDYDVDPGPDDYILTAGAEVLGTVHHLFFIKYSSDGELLWAFDLNNGGEYYGIRDIEINSAGEIYGAGYLSSTCDFDPGPDSEYGGLGDSYAAAFVVKYSSLGEFVWVKVTEKGEMGAAYGRGLVLDPGENLYIAGNYSGDIDFLAGPGEIAIDPYSGLEKGAYIQKMNPEGDIIWVRGLNGDLVIGYDIALDEFNNVYTVGKFREEVDFDPGPGYNFQDGSIRDNIFISKLTGDGDFVWGKALVSEGTNNRASSVVVDPVGDIIVSGIFFETLDFDPGPEVFELTQSPGTYSNSYVLKLNDCDPLIAEEIDTVNSCDPFYWDKTGTTYYESKEVVHLEPNESGCDSLFRLVYTDESYHLHYEIDTCGPYTWIDGITYYENTILTYEYTNEFGCDSVISLDLEHEILTSTTIVKCCEDEYTWIDGVTYDSDIITYDTLTSIYGCDSVVTLDLEFIWFSTLVSVLPNKLLVSDPDADKQWLDCDDDMSIIPGQNASFFYPDEPGYYAVELERFGCKDTSDCVYYINTVGLEENGLLDGVSISPNPSEHSFFIDLNDLRDVSLSVYNANGQLIYETTGINQPKFELDLSEYSGVFILDITSNNTSRKFKLIRL